MVEAILWWLTLQLLALLSLVPSLRLFRSLPDRGYGLAKTLGLLLASYGLWLLGWTGFLPNGRPTIVFVLFLLALASAYLAFRKGDGASLAAFIRGRWRLMLTTEAVFAVSFFALSLLRAYHPDIAGTEQPMDFAFLNATLRSAYFPPNDPWFSGQPISYYYFGYLMQTVPIQVTGIPPSLGYNLALASTFALTVTGSFSLGYNLVATRSPRAAPRVGVLAAVLVAVIGNLQGALELVRARGLGTSAFWQWIGVNGALTPYVSPSWQPTEHFWWWHATRVINTLRITAGPGGSILAVDDRLDYTITEFPFFSFLLGDMHPHVMALPFVLLALGLALALLRTEEGQGWLRRETWHFLGAALILGALGFINSWDLPTYMAVALGALLLAAARRGQVGWGLLGVMAALAGASILLYLPFYLGPKPQAQGPGLVGAVGTRPIHFFIVWGPFLFALGCFLLGRLGVGAGGARARPRLLLLCLAAALAPLALWALGQGAVQQVLGQTGLSWATAAGKELSVVPLVLTVGFLLFLLAGGAKRQSPEESFVLLLALVGLSLTLSTELFFLRDAFGNRMNTMFKFYYQAWVLFAIASAYGIYWVAANTGASKKGVWLRNLWQAGLAVFLISALAYPAAASYSRTDMFKGKPSLDGLAFVKGLDPSEYEAIGWLNTHVEGSPVIIEAPGGSYTDYGRVSSRTGLPTVVQWQGHQIQWRGASKELGDREQDVNQIYASADTALVQRLLDKYGARYVYVGRLERARYGEAALGKFASMMEVAFQNQEVIIYRVRS